MPKGGVLIFFISIYSAPRTVSVMEYVFGTYYLNESLE